MNDAIPFLDLAAMHRDLEDEFSAVFLEAIKTGRFIGGPMVEGFERDFAEFCGTKHCIAVSNGTDALRFSLLAAGIKPGEVVLTVPNTFIATTEAISQAGAVPEFIDINERTYNLDPDVFADYLQNSCYIDNSSGKPISKRFDRPVSAVMPVHLYGQMVDMDIVLEIARQYKLLVIEDACQAHGAEYFSKREGKWKKSGSMGNTACFSFYPGKNLGALGEGGAVTTNDVEIDRNIRMLRDHGQAKKYFHDIEGYNGRFDAMQCGFLRVKLRHLTQWNEQRRKAARLYDEMFASMPEIISPYEPDWSRAVYHLYVIRAPDRDEMQKKLTERNIGTGLHYPVPLHLQNAYKQLGYKKGDFPVSEKVAEEILSLPMFPGLTGESISYIIECILDCLKIAA